jgi:hypothetical protein
MCDLVTSSRSGAPQRKAAIPIIIVHSHHLIGTVPAAVAPRHNSTPDTMQLLQNKIAGAPVAVQQRRSRVQNARQTHVRVQAAAATEVKLNTTKSDEVSKLCGSTPGWKQPCMALLAAATALLNLPQPIADHEGGKGAAAWRCELPRCVLLTVDCCCCQPAGIINSNQPA